VTEIILYFSRCYAYKPFILYRHPREGEDPALQWIPGQARNDTFNCLLPDIMFGGSESTGRKPGRPS
jgi:hypothetical protein